MALAITFLGHSGFVLDDGSHKLAIDPFLTGNPVALHTADDIKVQSVALTHGHGDHMGDTAAIAKANDATVYGCHEIAVYLEGEGCKTEGGNPGGKIETPFGWVAFTQAFHSSSWMDGRYMGAACGLVIRMGGITLYHLGDTGLFRDLEMLGEIYKPDIACIPIGDRYTMGPELGTRAAEWVGAKVAIPMHYGTFPLLVGDASGFNPQGVEVKVMDPGETWEPEVTARAGAGG